MHTPETQTPLEGTESNGRRLIGDVYWPPDFENQFATHSIQNVPSPYLLCAQHCGRGPGGYPLLVWVVIGIRIVNDNSNSTSFIVQYLLEGASDKCWPHLKPCGPATWVLFLSSHS